MASIPLDKVRNIGISAHIDSGKTTLSERILFYTGKIHAIEEVRASPASAPRWTRWISSARRGSPSSRPRPTASGTATTSTSSTPPATSTSRSRSSARCACSTAPSWCCAAVAGVQSQSYTVDRQMRRYNVPRLAFINKLDRAGANPARVTDQLKEKLRHNTGHDPAADRRRGQLRGRSSISSR